ncbi:MAG TPA: c-type cytochrome biogenesis protein CcsB [Streptosporangiaceae bacterium]
MVDKDLASLSNQLMLGTVLLYVTAMVGYAADLAFGRRTDKAAAPLAVQEPALVGAAAQPAQPAELAEPAEPAPPEGAVERRQVDWGRFAVLMTVLAWGVHLGEIATRGMAAHRLPWGNMYEFTSAICFAAVTAYLAVLTRQRVRFLGAFLMVGVVLGLGVATIWLYDDPGPLVPALNSYWIAIHVTAAITATGTFSLAAVITVLYLVAARDTGRFRLPPAENLDRLANRITMFGFPIWTFAIMAGAIWADQAWGRYWGWDPKETWSFITWVCYAGYLHARATAGWRGRRAAVISLIAFGCLLFNFFGINFLVSGLHSYAGG